MHNTIIVSVLRTNNAIGKMNAIQVIVKKDTSAVVSFFQPVSGLFSIDVYHGCLDL